MTAVITTVAGYEKRNANGAVARGRWNVTHGLKTREPVANLLAFVRRCKDHAHGLRFTDGTDFAAVAQPSGAGNGVTKTFFALVKHCASSGITETGTITRPAAGTVKITVNGVLKTTGVAVDTTPGIATFTSAPANGAVLIADFAFDAAARFCNDQMDITLEAYDLGRWGQIGTVEIRG